MDTPNFSDFAYFAAQKQIKIRINNMSRTKASTRNFPGKCLLIDWNTDEDTLVVPMPLYTLDQCYVTTPRLLYSLMSIIAFLFYYVLLCLCHFYIITS